MLRIMLHPSQVGAGSLSTSRIWSISLHHFHPRSLVTSQALVDPMVEAIGKALGQKPPQQNANDLAQGVWICRVFKGGGVNGGNPKDSV